MKELNVLLLSAGRRVELIKCFQNASSKLNIISKIIAADCSDTAPALYFADKAVKLPRISDPNYIEEVVNVCLTEKIYLIVPTIDTDLLLLSQNREYIESITNAKVLISDQRVIEICRDKIKTQEFLEQNNFGTAKMYTKEEIENNEVTYPVFIKPKSGSSSINAYKVNDNIELSLYMNIIKDPIVQAFMEGDEYTVDVFLDFKGKTISIVPRLRIATRSGEISKGKIIKDREIINDVARLVKVLGPVGPITVQLKKDRNVIKYIEINPRFGGGAPMSIQSGADSCLYLYKLLMGETLEYSEDYSDNVTFLRFDSSICLDENMEIIKW